MNEILALFDTQSLKLNNFLWVCLFLGKNLSNFVPTAWKHHNPYCHNFHYPSKYHATIVTTFKSLEIILWSPKYPVQWKLRDFLKGSTLLYPGCLAGGTVQIWVWAPSEKVSSLRTCKVFDLLVIIIFTKRSSVPKGMSAHLGIFYYRLFFLRSIAHFFTQIYMNCLFSL